MLEYFLDFKFLILIFILYLLYRLGTYKQNLHIKLGRNGPTPLPFIGNLATVSWMGIYDFDKYCRDKFGHIYPSYFGSTPITIVSDEVLLKQMLIKDFRCFTDRLDIGIKSKTTEKMLTLLKGKDWERVRNLISPTFTSGKLKKMSPLLSNCVDLLMKRLEDHPSETNIVMKDFFGALTMDAIAKTMFGMDINSQNNPNNLFIVNANKIFNISILNPSILLMILFPSLDPIIRKYFPNWEPLGHDAMSFFSTNLHKAIEERKASKEEYSDFLALMLNAGREESDEGKSSTDERYLTPEEIAAQSLIFLIAGYETMATNMTYLSYFLAKNPESQEEIYDELIDVIGAQGEITYEALFKLNLLDGAINESLRLLPPAVRFDRQCTQDIDLVCSDNRIIPAKVGDIFAVPVYAIHTDPAIWPNPDTFDIHRFDRDQKKDRSAYAHMPFGMGPRNCVGMRFALLETKWAFATILRDYQLVTCPETPETIKFKRFTFGRPAKPIILKVQRRS